MGDVVIMNGITRLNVPADRVLSAALEYGLEQVVIVGYDKDGEEYFASSIADGGTVLWLFERCKKKLVSIDGD